MSCGKCGETLHKSKFTGFALIRGTPSSGYEVGVDVRHMGAISYGNWYSYYLACCYLPAGFEQRDTKSLINLILLLLPLLLIKGDCIKFNDKRLQSTSLLEILHITFILRSHLTQRISETIFLCQKTFTQVILQLHVITAPVPCLGPHSTHSCGGRGCRACKGPETSGYF